MLVMMRFGRRWIPLGLISLGIISFLASQWGAYHLPSANFFFAADPLLGTADWGRSWVLFVTQKGPPPGGSLTQDIIPEGLAILGLVFIAFAVLSYDETVPFPGFLALFPTLGTALILGFASPQTLIGQFLSTKAVGEPGNIKLQYLPVASPSVGLCSPRQPDRTRRHPAHDSGLAFHSPGLPELAVR